MKISIKSLLPLCAVILLSAAGAMAQKSEARNHGSNPGVVIVSSAAKGTWAVTKFTAATVAKPVAKMVLLQAAPAIGKFILKNAAKEALPLALKLSVL